MVVFLKEIAANKLPYSICDEKESKEILFPNSYNSNALISYEEPNKAWSIVSERQSFGIQSLIKKLNGITIKEKVSKLKWEMAVKRLNNYKQKLVRKYTQKKLFEIKKAMEEQTNGNT